MRDALNTIWEAKREEVLALLSSGIGASLKSRARDAEPTRGFLSAIADSRHDVALIAEVKKGSPLKGVIREPFCPVSVAQDYEAAGADCISVLTDQSFFYGNHESLTLCRDATSIPVLRKDFLLDEIQIYESRALGSDAILLIVGGPETGQLRELRELAQSLGMDVLVEAHSLSEAEIALASGATLIGINNRNLDTFQTEIATAVRIIPGLAGKAIVVSESAMSTAADVRLVQEAGARAVLIGTAFCTSPDIQAKVKAVMGW